MARSKKIISLDELGELRRRNVRYGRSRLTISRWGSVVMSDVAQALAAERRGEVDAKAVAWAFVRDRVEDHSPSFRWEDADLDKVLRLVVGCSEDPHLTAQTPEELVAELKRVEADERERLKRSQEKLRRSLSAMTFDWSKAFKLPSLNDQILKQMRSPAFKMPPTLNEQLGAQLKAVQPGLALAESLNHQFASMRNSLQMMSRLTEVPRIEPLRVDATLWNSVGRLIDSYRNQLSVREELMRSMATTAQLHDLSGLTAELLQATRETQQEEAAQALEITVEVVQSDLSPDELASAFADRIKPMFESLEAKVEKSQPSLAEKLLLLLVAAVITLAIQAALVRLGVPLEIPTPQSTTEQPTNRDERGVVSPKSRLHAQVDAISDEEAERVLPMVQNASERATIGAAIAEGYRRVPQTTDEDAWAEANARAAIREERW